MQHREDAEAAELAKERRRQEAIPNIKKTFGKNAILRGLNFEDGATQRERNQQIGGHHSKYDEIINMLHHVSEIHKLISPENRAAQFAPFAALTGNEEAIADTARLTTER